MSSLFRRAWRHYRNNGVKSLLGAVPRFVQRTLTQPYPHYRLHNWIWRKRNGEGTPVMERDWDTLIVLDACRFDSLKQANPFDTPVKQRVSRGSNTTEFLHRNFLGEKYYDTVYLTANPKVLKLENGHYGEESIFHATVSLLDKWDDETHTVLPETTAKEALAVREEYPDKRLIVHFVQPHLPYIGETADRIREEMDASIGGWDIGNMNFVETTAKPINGGLSSFDIITDDQSDIGVEEFRQAYRESLSITLDSVEMLVRNLDGKTVITSDHGEMFGERPFPFGTRVYGHPKRTCTDELCLVPWIKKNDGNRRDIVAEEPDNSSQENAELIEDRLRALGYT